MKTVNGVTLDELNDNLITKLNALVDEAGAEDILSLTEAIAKLNASRRNSDQFAKPQTEEERLEAERAAVLGEVIGGEAAS